MKERKKYSHGRNSLKRTVTNSLKHAVKQGALHLSNTFGPDALVSRLDNSNPDNWDEGPYRTPEKWANRQVIQTIIMPVFMIFGVCMGVVFIAQFILSFRKKMRAEHYHERMREMRKIRKPHSDNPPPSHEELATQWNKVHDSLQEMLKFGNMLIDLEASDLIDNSPILNYDTSNGVPVIVARKPGLRGWLAEHCPHIGYKTAMRYKALAQKAQKVPTKMEQFIKKSSTICELSENLYKELKIEHYKFEKPRKPRAKLRTNGLERFRQPGAGDRKLQPLIFSFRTNTRTALKKLSPEQQQQFIDSLLSLAKECGETLRQSTRIG